MSQQLAHYIENLPADAMQITNQTPKPKQAKRTRQDLLYEIVTQILRGMRSNSIKSLVRLSGTALKSCLAELKEQKLIENAGKTSFKVTACGLLWHAWQKASRSFVALDTWRIDELRLNAFRQKIADKLAWLRRSPNVKAAERTISKPDEALHKNIVNCGCTFEANHIEHTRCYYQYDNGWLFESRVIMKLRRKLAPMLTKIGEIDQQIDYNYTTLRTLNMRALGPEKYTKTRNEINSKIHDLKTEKHRLEPELHTLQTDLDFAECELAFFELEQNGIITRLGQN